jgi:SAM-dependent methyltransferase
MSIASQVSRFALKRRRPSRLDARSPEQIREHYEIERELAERLQGAAKGERRLLYRTLYDELFRRVPHHPQLMQKSSPATKAREVGRQLGLLGRFLAPATRFLEVGPGDCALAFAVAERVKWVYGVDVSDTITKQAMVPGNFTLLTTDGSSIDLAPDTVDLAYSNQLMEHLHPEDALDQLRNIFRVLVPGGRYVIVTPNRLSGPWDVTRYFDRVARGFHLKEYTVGDLRSLLQAAGFRQVGAYVGARGLFVKVPTGLICVLERVLAALPEGIGWIVAHTTPVRLLLGMRLVAAK